MDELFNSNQKSPSGILISHNKHLNIKLYIIIIYLQRY